MGKEKSREGNAITHHRVAVGAEGARAAVRGGMPGAAVVGAGRERIRAAPWPVAGRRLPGALKLGSPI